MREGGKERQEGRRGRAAGSLPGLGALPGPGGLVGPSGRRGLAVPREGGGWVCVRGCPLSGSRGVCVWGHRPPVVRP